MPYWSSNRYSLNAPNDNNAKAIANAIERLMLDKNFYRMLTLKGRRKIIKEFNIKKNVKDLLSLFKEV